MSSFKSKRSSRQPRSTLIPQSSSRGDMDDKKQHVQAYCGQLHALLNSQEHLICLHKNCNSYEKALMETNYKDDVLVKHMMNLPDYLQRVNEGKYVQGKALNYGVLDWHHLEKWKGSNTNSSAYGDSVRRKQAHLFKEQNSLEIKDYSESMKRCDGQKRPHFKDKSSSKNYSSVKVARENESGQKFAVNKTLEDRVDSSSQKNCSHSLLHSRAKSLCEGELETIKSDDFPDLVPFEGDIYMEKRPKLQNSSFPGTTLALQRLSLDEVSSNANAITNHGIKNILSRRYNYVSHSDRFINGLNQLKRSLSFNQESYFSEQNYGKLNYGADPDISSSGAHSQIPHSCSLIAGAEANCEAADILSMELPKLSSQSDRFDLVSKGGDHLSPERSFSFRLRKRLGRSFSSRESFDITQFSSVYTPMVCGAVNSEMSDSSSKKDTEPAARVMISPLRRLLYPIFKRKTAKPDEKTNANKVSSASSSATASFQAVLQVVTSTNGFPLFKLLVNNSNNIIIAMKTSNPPQIEGTSSCIYTLYAGQESKKNGNWMNPNDKGKSCGFGYTAVGHLKVYLPCSNSQKRFGEVKHTTREWVLYSIENGDAGKVPKLTAGRELAAIIVEDGPKGFMNGNSKTTVLLPERVHSLPNKGEPSPLIERWRYEGSCDCGGWDAGCQLQILTNEDLHHSESSSSTDCFIPDHLHLFFNQGSEDKKAARFSLAKYKEGTYMVEFIDSISSLQACSICIAAVANRVIPFCQNDSISSSSSFNNGRHIFKGDEEDPIKYVPFPPISPVERV